MPLGHSISGFTSSQLSVFLCSLLSPSPLLFQLTWKARAAPGSCRVVAVTGLLVCDLLSLAGLVPFRPAVSRLGRSWAFQCWQEPKDVPGDVTAPWFSGHQMWVTGPHCKESHSIKACDDFERGESHCEFMSFVLLLAARHWISVKIEQKINLCLIIHYLKEKTHSLTIIFKSLLQQSHCEICKFAIGEK